MENTMQFPLNTLALLSTLFLIMLMHSNPIKALAKDPTTTNKDVIACNSMCDECDNPCQPLPLPSPPPPPPVVECPPPPSPPPPELPPICPPPPPVPPCQDTCILPPPSQLPPPPPYVYPPVPPCQDTCILPPPSHVYPPPPYVYPPRTPYDSPPTVSYFPYMPPPSSAFHDQPALTFIVLFFTCLIINLLRAK